METKEEWYYMGKFLNKKAQTPGDTILIFVFIFAIGIAAVFGFFIYHEMINAFSQDPTMNNTAGVMDAMRSAEQGNINMDYVMIFLYIGLTLALVVMGYFIQVESIFLVFYIIFLLIGVMVSAILSYVWSHFADTVQFTATISNNFPITDFMLSNFTIFYLFSAAVAMIATFAKSDTGGM